MFRIKLAVIIGGGALAFFGFQEFRVSSGTSAEAESVELSDLEAGSTPSNHIRVGEHMALYYSSVYSYSSSSYSSGEPPLTSSVDYSYHPILSAEHPFTVALADALDAVEKDGAGNDDGINIPELEDFRVLVKTRRFDTIGDIPDGIDTVDSVQGLIINQIDQLDSKEKKLINESFPGLDLDSVLILEEGRKPSSPLKWGGMLGGGALLVLGGVAWLFLGAGHSQV